MFDIQNYPQFILAIVLFQLIPGAGTLAILNATAQAGVRMGMAAVAGTLLGDAAYMLAAALGLAAVMQAHPSLFAALQWFGVAYLLWLAWGLLRARRDAGAVVAAPPASAGRYLRQTALVSLTNPKVMLFFVAFFPLFLKSDASALTLGVMMAHVTVISFLYQAALVLVGNWVARRLMAWPMAGVWAKRLAGVALVGFAAKLSRS
ncbi:MAG: LysE family translocator [Formosimonas sp.]